MASTYMKHSLYHPLYNTTYTIHRVSPLFTQTFAPPTNAYLATFERRFRNILAGDVLRGVRVGLAIDSDNALARVGALTDVRWEVLVSEEQWDAKLAREVEDGERDTRPDSSFDMEGNRGILIRVQYERAMYLGVLLRGHHSEGGEEQRGFHRYPLLMTKMPVSLKETFIQFLSETFDVKIVGLRTDDGLVAKAFERYIKDASLEEEEELTAEVTMNARALRRIVKDVQVTIAFDLPGGSNALKNIDIRIDKEDIPRMVANGQQLADDESPFLAALNEYVKKHMALDLGHATVRIIKIACGAFVLGEGRLKLILPGIGEGVDVGQRLASRNLVDGLIRLAEGGDLKKMRLVLDI